MINFETYHRMLPNTSSWHFDQLALQIFRFQYQNNPIYRKYIDHLGIDISTITDLHRIPFIPVEFFKHHRIKSGDWQEQVIFTSSATTASQPGRHYVPDRQFYLDHTLRLFEAKYGPITDYEILALLPGYLERTGSSLVAMADWFIRSTGSSTSGFYLYDHDRLRSTIDDYTGSRKLLLIGVSFALLDLAEAGEFPRVPNLTVMETGGMKGRRRELIREELHGVLCEAFGVSAIHSEYGMTEAMSQAYSSGNGIFEMPPTMRILLRDPNDPFDVDPARVNGAINIIDLANAASCAFIQTSDMGRKTGEDTFEILGRIDNSDIRGCNLMVQSALY